MRQRSGRGPRWVAWCAVSASALAAAGGFAASPGAKGGLETPQAAPTPTEQQVFQPAVKAIAEILRPDGKPRLYPKGESQEAMWEPGMPVYIGDKIVLKAFVSTGDAELKEVRFRLNNQLVRKLNRGPWSIELDTRRWSPGYHFIEVFGQSANDLVPSGSDTLVLMLREAPPATVAAPAPAAPAVTPAPPAPAVDPVAAAPAATPPVAPGPPAHPGQELAVGDDGKPVYPAGVEAKLQSRHPEMGEALREGRLVRVNAPMVVEVKGGPKAHRFVYALVRDGREVFRSEMLPLTAVVRLQPKLGENGAGLRPGMLTLWVWVGDEKNAFGAPVTADLEIVP